MNAKRKGPEVEHPDEDSIDFAVTTSPVFMAVELDICRYPFCKLFGVFMFELFILKSRCTLWIFAQCFESLQDLSSGEGEFVYR